MFQKYVLITKQEANGVLLVSYGPWTFLDNESETLQELEEIWNNVNHETPVVDESVFVGLCFHHQQQCLGTLMYGRWLVVPEHLLDCSGSPVKEETWVNVGNLGGFLTMTIKELLEVIEI